MTFWSSFALLNISHPAMGLSPTLRFQCWNQSDSHSIVRAHVSENLSDSHSNPVRNDNAPKSCSNLHQQQSSRRGRHSKYKILMLEIPKYRIPLLYSHWILLSYWLSTIPEQVKFNNTFRLKHLNFSRLSKHDAQWEEGSGRDSWCYISILS